MWIWFEKWIFEQLSGYILTQLLGFSDFGGWDELFFVYWDVEEGLCRKRMMSVLMLLFVGC